MALHEEIINNKHYAIFNGYYFDGEHYIKYYEIVIKRRFLFWKYWSTLKTYKYTDENTRRIQLHNANKYLTNLKKKLNNG